MNEASAILKGEVTRREILGQPELWLDTAERLAKFCYLLPDVSNPVVFTGAGTSAYAAEAIAAAWPSARAVPSTDLLLNPGHYFEAGTPVLVSLARSGDSPESTAVVERIQNQFPSVRHIAITCNAEGNLARMPGVDAIILHPLTNDRSLAMTSSFSNLVLAGLCLRHRNAIEAALPKIAKRVAKNMEEISLCTEKAVSESFSRLVVLASPALFPAAREIALKVLEMTGGTVVTLPETFLGLRHGPMSFLRHDSCILALLSNDPAVRRYEEDLIAELNKKRLGRVITVGGTEKALAPELPDELRTPFEIVFGQLFAFHLSLSLGYDPDSPSPDAVITRVVQGVRIYDN